MKILTTMKMETTIQRIIILVIIALLIQFSMLSFTVVKDNGGDGPEMIERVNTITQENKDQNVLAILAELNIPIAVDAAALEAKYPSVKLATQQNGKGVTLTFHNPEARTYRLDVYDIDGFVAASYINIQGEAVTVDHGLMKGGEYTYKLEGEGNTYCGKIVLL